MKIMHIITGLNNGGAEGVLYRLVTNDKKNKHIIISMMDSGKYGPFLTEQGFEVHCLNMNSGKVSPKSILKLYKYIKDNRPDVVQTWMYHADLIGGLVAKSLGVRKVFWNLRHSNFDSNHTKSSTIKIAKLNAKMSKVLPNKIICCAEGAVEAHTDLGYEKDKIVVIGNGYDLNTFKIDNDARKIIRNELDIGKKPVLGMVGRYDPQKNHKGLIEALGVVKKEGYNFDLILVGRDLNRDNKILLKAIREHDLFEEVHLLDQRNDIPSVMNALDIHVLSSSYGEGFPNVIAEAMACGTPCIATDIGDSKIIVNEYGSIVEPNNTKELSSAIMSNLDLMKNETVWNNLVLSSRRHITENFSIENMVASYRNVWEGKHHHDS